MVDRDPDSWMWERARAFLEEADRLTRTPRRPPGGGSHRPSWQPPIDVFETATEVWIVVALPGVEATRVEVEIDGPTLVVHGDRALPPIFRSACVHRLEIPHGRFERRVGLPPGTYEMGRREMVDGCLFLCLRKLG